METFDLEPFVAFMKSRGLPPERNIPYYASWVRRYLQVEMPGVIADSTDKIRYFCEQLARKMVTGTVPENPTADLRKQLGRKRRQKVHIAEQQEQQNRMRREDQARVPFHIVFS